jgi:hypothetical protein
MRSDTKCPNNELCGGFLQDESYMGNPHVCRKCHYALDSLVEYNSDYEEDNTDTSNLVIIDRFDEDCPKCNSTRRNNLFRILHDSTTYGINLFVYRDIIGDYLYDRRGIKLPQCEHIYCFNCFKINFMWSTDDICFWSSEHEWYIPEPQFPFPEREEEYNDNDYAGLETDDYGFILSGEIENPPEWLQSQEMRQYRKDINKYWMDINEIENNLNNKAKSSKQCVKCLINFSGHGD